MEGLYTYDRVSLSNAHIVAQFVQSLYILLSSSAHGDVFHNEALVTPRAHGLNVELFIFRCDV
jgi:hypothetical protein